MPGSDDMEPVRAPNSGLKLTYDDYLLFPEDGQRHELIDGDHYVTPAPNIRHQRISGRLFQVLANWLDEHPVGEVFSARTDVLFSKFNVVEPDVLYLSKERAAELLTDANIKGAPDLVIEIASRGTRQRDETIKRRLYERFGVGEYWIVDPEIDVIRVYRQTGKSFARAVELSREAGDVVTTPLLPGLEIPLSRVFEN